MSTEAEGKEAIESQPPGPSAPADERSYVAFISYRHKELDREAAIRIQKKIENYIVPKEYREKVGGKKLGIVFRDEDELPASSSLSDSITYALDHTQYLIVICTPDLPQSKWCLQEVSYFLQTHDRDHVLAVLVDGTPEESFPEQLRFTYDAEGRQLAEVEPLAANIAGENHSINKKAFNKEVVRLFAAIIGCPFDALWQRERRAKTNRLIAAMGVGLSAMAVVIGIVLSKNAQISEQNTQILQQNDQIKQQVEQISEQKDQISEQNTKLQQQMSSVLVDAGKTQLEAFDRKAALTSALSALENNDPAVYDHRVEEVLATALGSYTVEEIQSSLLCEQNTGIRQLAVTADGKTLLTTDDFATVRAFETETGELRWQVPLMTWDSLRLYPINSRGLVICKTYDDCIALSIEDGSTVWSFPYKKSSAFQILSEDESIFVVMDRGVGTDEEPGAALYFLDTGTGVVLREVAIPCDSFQVRSSKTEDYFYEYAGDFSEDKTWFACAIPVENSTEDPPRYVIFFSIDLTDGSIQRIGSSGEAPDMILSLVCYEPQRSVYCTLAMTRYLYSYVIPVDPDQERITFSYNYSLSSLTGLSTWDYGYEELPYLPPLNNSELSVVFSRNVIYLMNLNNGKMRNTMDLDSAILRAEWIDPEEEIFQVFTANGKCIRYDVSHYDNKAVESAESEDTPVSNAQTAVFIRSGPVVNPQDGLIVQSLSDAPGQLILSRVASETGLRKLEGRNAGSSFSYVTLTPSEERLIVFTRIDSQSTLWETCDLSTGNWNPAVTLPFCPPADMYQTIRIPDEDHVIYENRIYGLDGSITEVDADFPYRMATSEIPTTILLTDGSLLSTCGSAAVFGDIRLQHVCAFSCRLDGVLLEDTETVEDGLTVHFHEDHPHLFAAGKNGWIGAWGNHIYIDEEGSLMGMGDTAVAVKNIYTGEKVLLEETKNGQVVDNLEFSHSKPLLTVIYKSGDIQLFDLSDGGRLIMSISDYEYGELYCTAYSDQDSYFLLMTEMNQLDCYDTATGELVFTQNEVFYEKHGAKFGMLHVLEDQTRKRMFIWIDYFMGTGTSALVLDTEAWVRTTSIRRFLGFSRTEQMLIVGTGDPFYTCPYYPVDDLAGQAREYLN